jgi:hypothetical protein
MMPGDATGAAARRKTDNTASQPSPISKNAANSIIYAEANCDMQNRRNVTTPKSMIKQWVEPAEIVTPVTTRHIQACTATNAINAIDRRVEVADRRAPVSPA